MNLKKIGKLLCNLRKSKGMTQKQVADRLGVLPKTVSKWETGHGFPDTSLISGLSEILGVSIDTILSGNLTQNMEEVGNMKKIKFYVCPHCGSFLQGTGENQIICCGKQLESLKAKNLDENHRIKVDEIENDYYITFNHEMTKEHYISFLSYVSSDRVFTVKLYPEQDSSARFPKMFGGKFYFYCNTHGLFMQDMVTKKTTKDQSGRSLTSLMSAFSRAYVNENSSTPIFRDSLARKLFLDEEYRQLEQYIQMGGGNVKEYVYTNLAPTPLARSKFCEECLETAIKTGTTQYVLLGSGLDTYAFRNRNKQLKIFEIDKEATIKDKKMRMARAGFEMPVNLKSIPADLSKDDLKIVLERSGFNRYEKTVFSCLGLVYYLTTDEISKLLENISSFAAEGSTIVFDFADSHLFSSDVPRVKNMLAMAEQSGEPMKSCFGYSELERLLEQHDFLIYEFLNTEEIQHRYFSECQNEMKAFEHINYVQAVLKK